MAWGVSGFRVARRAVPVLLAAAVAVPLAGCGGGPEAGSARSAPAGAGAESRLVPTVPPTLAAPPPGAPGATGLPSPPGSGSDRYGGAATTPPPPTGPCPSSGLRVTAGPPDGAAGLRVLTLSVTDCARGDRTVSGYPRVEVLGTDHRPVHVDIHQGITVTDAIDDPAPTRLRLHPGERATAALAWRDLVTGDGTGPYAPVVGSALRIAVGGPAQTLPATLDLGSAGRLDITAWYQAG